LEVANTQNATTTHEPANADNTFAEKFVMAVTLFQLILGTGDITGMKVLAILKPNNGNLGEYTDISQQICDARGRHLARKCQGRYKIHKFGIISLVVSVYNTLKETK